MLLQNILRINNNYRFFSLSSQCMIDQRWRRERRLPLNPNSEGVLVQKPDYSFLNGKPTPYGSRHKERIMKQRDYSEKIISLSKEIDFALDRYNQNIEAKVQRRQDIIRSKLKAKGKLLLSE